MSDLAEELLVAPLDSARGALLRRDLGPFILGAAALVAVGLLAFAFVSVRSAREAYLWSAFFHAPLEVAAAALFAVEGRRFADAPT